jgi:phosphate:Na+ symporter
MKHLLNLLAAVALLVWGTYLVRTGILRVFGANLRHVLGRSIKNRFTAALSGVGVTALLQSSTATALIVAAFVGQGLITLPLALAVMLGADVGTSLMVVVLSFDLSWLAPLMIFVGVVLFMSRQTTDAGRFGRVMIGLGLMLLALRLISETTQVMVQSEAVRVLLASISSDLLLEITIGALLTLPAYSSLAMVLLTATLTASGIVTLDTALGLVLGANLGSGILGVLTTARSAVEVRHVPLGNLLFRAAGVALAAPAVGLWITHARPFLGNDAAAVVMFHLTLNLAIVVLFLGFTGVVARVVTRWLPKPERDPTDVARYLDVSALSTPSLAFSCAAREALHLADVVLEMLRGVLEVIKTDDLELAKEVRNLDDTVDELYSAIKYYLIKIPREALDEDESRRWTEIIGFSISMEQIGDTIERVLDDIEVKKIRKGRTFSEAGMAEIIDLHARLVDNLRLAMTVFLNGSVRDAQKLLEEKARFRDLELQYASTHLGRLAGHTVQSIETSSLHIDLISDFKRINSLICSIAYPILESAGALAPSRLRRDVLAAGEAHR